MKIKINIQIFSIYFFNDVKFHFVERACTSMSSHNYLYIKYSTKLSSYTRIRIHEVGSCLTINTGLLGRKKKTGMDIITS